MKNLSFGEADKNKALKQIVAALGLEFVYAIIGVESFLGFGVGTIALIIGLVGIANLAYYISTKQGKLIGILSFIVLFILYGVLAPFIRHILD